MASGKLLKSPESTLKPRALRVCRSWGRLILLSVGFLVLLIGVAWAFGAMREAAATSRRASRR